MGTKAKYIWMDGEMLPSEEATVHFMAPPFIMGWGSSRVSGVMRRPAGRQSFAWQIISSDFSIRSTC